MFLQTTGNYPLVTTQKTNTAVQWEFQISKYVDVSSDKVITDS
jgi:hypothetical protein